MIRNNKEFRRIQYGLISSLVLIGILAGFICYSVFASQDKSEALRKMRSMTEYMKKQCVRYDDISAEGQTKSLISVVDKAYQVRKDISKMRSVIDEALLRECIADQRLTGIIVTDNATGQASSYCADGLGVEDWAPVLARLSSVSGNLQKSYAERLTGTNGYCYDYAVISREDGNGVVFCYLRQDRRNVEGTPLSVSTLLEDFNVVNITVVVTDNGYIIASNRADLSGQFSADSPVVRQLRSAPDNGGLIHVKEDGVTYYAVRGNVKGYYIYTYQTEGEVLAGCYLKLACFAVIYLVFAGIALLVFFAVVRSKEREQEKQEAEYHDEVDRLAKEAVRANQAKTDFLRRMSHDIRTPINGIQGIVRIAEHCADDPEKQRECRKKVLDASNYLLELVNDILDMNKLDSGELVWKDESFLLPELLDSVVSLTKYQAAEHGITLHFTDGGIRNTRLFGGAVPLKRICLNLISNAVKYNKPNGTVDFTARQVSYDRDSGKTLIEFVCADTGIGMSEEFQKKMYEPFVQEDVSYHSTLGGTGLGLAIVRRLVDRMGGEISAVSEKNKGTTFTVRLPFLTEAVPPEENPKEIPSYSVNPEHIPDGAKILLTEDNELNMEIAEFMLKTAGVEVLKAFNGKEAVEVFSRSEPGEIRLILMDVMMPEMDGIEATRKIRALNRPDAATIPIIAMTANAYADDVERVLSAGMNAHVPKPVDPGKLLRLISEYLSDGPA